MWHTDYDRKRYIYFMFKFNLFIIVPWMLTGIFFNLFVAGSPSSEGDMARVKVEELPEDSDAWAGQAYCIWFWALWFSQLLTYHVRCSISYCFCWVMVQIGILISSFGGELFRHYCYPYVLLYIIYLLHVRLLRHLHQNFLLYDIFDLPLMQHEHKLTFDNGLYNLNIT